MSEPEPSKPKDLEISPEATVRLVAGMPLDPRRTQQLDISNIISQHQDAGSTQRLLLPPTEAPAEETQKLLLHPVLDDATVRMQKLDPPIEDAGSAQRLTLSEPAASSEDTQKIPRSVVDDATVRIQKLEPPAEAVGSAQQSVQASAEVTAGGTQKFMRPGVDDATVRMQKVDPPIEHAGSTSRLPLPETSSEATQKIPRHTMDDPPLRVKKVDQPAEAAGQTQKLPLQPQAPKAAGWKLPLALGAVVVLVAVAFVAFSRTPVPQTAVVVPPPPQTGPEPAGAQAYLDKAKAGDVYAMRMLGTMYYNGLNVPQDREKGLYWYRKAAEKSDAARAELSQIEGGR